MWAPSAGTVMLGDGADRVDLWFDPQCPCRRRFHLQQRARSTDGIPENRRPTGSRGSYMEPLKLRRTSLVASSAAIVLASTPCGRVDHA